MNSSQIPGSDCEVPAAIERVLSTERQAEGALDAARAQARATVADAGEQAARVAHRARQRIASMRERSAANLSSAIVKIEHSVSADSAEMLCGEPQLQRLVNRAAMELIGDEHDSKRR